MNALAQLIYDLDLDEALVLKRLKDDGLIGAWVKRASQVADEDTEELVNRIRYVLGGP